MKKKNPTTLSVLKCSYKLQVVVIKTSTLFCACVCACVVYSSVCASICDWEKSHTSDSKLTPESHSSNRRQTKLGVSAVLTHPYTRYVQSLVKVLQTTTPYVSRWGALSYHLWTHITKLPLNHSVIWRLTGSSPLLWKLQSQYKHFLKKTLLVLLWSSLINDLCCMKSSSILTLLFAAEDCTAAVMCIQIRFEKHKHTQSSQHHSQDKTNSSQAFP